MLAQGIVVHPSFFANNSSNIEYSFLFFFLNNKDTLTSNSNFFFFRIFLTIENINDGSKFRNNAYFKYFFFFVI